MFTNSQMLPFNLISTPPETILEVGPSPTVRFVAHSVVLSMHSGYIRSVIRLEDNGMPYTGELGPILLTNVTAEQFAPLLSYMYTGYLDLNVDNIFGILLATHVLHMPSAMEICRSFLSRVQSEGYLKENNSQVIRPIASKATVPNVGFVAAPMQPISLPSTGTPFKSIKTFKQEASASSTIVSSPKLEVVDNESSKTKNKKLLSAPSPTPLLGEKETNSKSKVIIDVASCDGPVRFRRVLNDSYGTIWSDSQLPTKERTQHSLSVSFHQQMAKTISQTQHVTEESENSEFSNNSKKCNGEVFACIYCKHTFKSQYCYQKHAKRHLNSLALLSTNPTSTDPAAPVTENLNDMANKTVEKPDKKVDRIAKREVRALDMNVQYYPCKTCGSKFPSYYFVHKHRKMFHADEESSDQAKN